MEPGSNGGAADFSPNPFQIYPRDWLRALQPMARKQLIQGNDFPTGTVFPKSSCSFDLGTGVEMGALSS